METRRLGTDGPRVSAIGLGCNGMSGTYGPTDEAENIATIRAAIDSGITLLDTADFYGMGHNEELIRKAMRAGDREKVALSAKFGALRDPDGGFVGVDGRLMECVRHRDLRDRAVAPRLSPKGGAGVYSLGPGPSSCPIHPSAWKSRSANIARG